MGLRPTKVYEEWGRRFRLPTGVFNGVPMVLLAHQR